MSKLAQSMDQQNLDENSGDEEEEKFYDFSQFKGAQAQPIFMMKEEILKEEEELV